MKACLIVIDFINEIVSPTGKAPSCASYVNENKVIAKANQAINFARSKNIPLIFVKLGFGPEYQELPKTSPIFSKAREKNAFLLGSEGCNFHPELDYQKTDAVVVKPRVSPFYGTSLEAHLRANQIDTLFIAGVSTNNAVQSCAKEGHDRDYQIYIIADACGAKDQKTHDNTIELLRDYSKIITVQEFIKI